jgi:endonuclease-8
VQSNGPVLEIGRGVRRRVGIDVLGAEAAPAGLVAAMRRADGRRLLGEVLLDQRFVAGIGNMWAAEALWHAGVSPWLPLEQAADDDLARVLGWAREAMQASVAGVVRSPRSVYRRAGRPCPRCGGRIESHGLGDANRIAYWCPHCQRGPSAGGRTA